MEWQRIGSIPLKRTTRLRHEKENYGERKKQTRLNKLENEKQMWIGNSQGNIDKLVNDVNIANSYKAGKGYTNNDEDNGL